MLEFMELKVFLFWRKLKQFVGVNVFIYIMYICKGMVQGVVLNFLVGCKFFNQVDDLVQYVVDVFIVVVGFVVGIVYYGKIDISGYDIECCLGQKYQLGIGYKIVNNSVIE